MHSKLDLDTFLLRNAGFPLPVAETSIGKGFPSKDPKEGATLRVRGRAL